MSTEIKLKKSSIAGKAPHEADIVYGEVALNYADGYLYYKANDNSVKSLSTPWDNITNNPVTDAGMSLFSVPNPNETTFLQINADNSVSTLNNTDFRESINAVERTSLTGAAVIPGGTEEERDITPSNGYIRYNTDTKHFEGYINDEWTPIAEAKEVTVLPETLGIHVVDTIPRTLVRSIKYDVQISAYGGYQTSELKILHDGQNAYVVEYGKIITHENIGWFSVDVVDDNIILSCDFIFPESILIFRREVRTNSGETYIGNDFLDGTGIIDLNEGNGTIDLGEFDLNA